jgi:hypothetical protein
VQFPLAGEIVALECGYSFGNYLRLGVIAIFPLKRILLLSRMQTSV